MAGKRITGVDEQGNPVVWNGATWVPDLVRNPTAPGAKLWGSVPQGTGDAAALRKQYATDEAVLTKEREALKRNRDRMALADTFESANSAPKSTWWKNDGGGTGGPLAGIHDDTAMEWARSLFYDQNPNVQIMKSTSGALQLGVPKSGDSNISNFERRLFSQGVPSVDKYGGVNQNLIGGTRATVAEHADYVDFLEKYRAANGTLAGADVAWNTYTSKNPYRTIVPVTKKQVEDYGFPALGKIVAKRPKGAVSWQQYFGLEPTAQAAAPAPKTASKSKAPAGVDQTAWDYMTPEERKLWSR